MLDEGGYVNGTWKESQAVPKHQNGWVRISRNGLHHGNIFVDDFQAGDRATTPRIVEGDFGFTKFPELDGESAGPRRKDIFEVGIVMRDLIMEAGDFSTWKPWPSQQTET